MSTTIPVRKRGTRWAARPCLETPQGVQIGSVHNRPVIVPGGLPMELTATGKTPRRSLVLILHDESQQPTTMDSTWTPRGLCTR